MHVRPIRFVSAGFHLGEGSFPMHRHPHWELIYQREGRVVTMQEHTAYEMAPGMLLLNPPGVEHCDLADRRYCVVYVGLQCDGDLGWPHQAFDDRHRTIGNLFDALARESRGIEQPENELLQLMLLQLDALMRRKCRESDYSEIDRKIAEARSVLESEADAEIDLDELAARLGMGRSSFFSHFTERCQMPPREFVRSIRAQRALAMLRQTDFTLETVAARCGYSSASHLSRHIRQVTGHSPGEFRRISLLTPPAFPET